MPWIKLGLIIAAIVMAIKRMEPLVVLLDTALCRRRLMACRDQVAVLHERLREQATHVKT